MSTSQFSGSPFTRTGTAVLAAPVTIRPPVQSLYAQVFNRGAVVVNLYFDSADAANGVNAIPLEPLGTVGDYWEGPAEFFPYDVTAPGVDGGEKTRGPVFVQSTGADAPVIAVFFQRR